VRLQTAPTIYAMFNWFSISYNWVERCPESKRLLSAILVLRLRITAMPSTEPQFLLRPMTTADAHTIAAWRYAGVYAFYDFTADPADLAELLTPETWGRSYFSVDDMNQELVGFFQFKQQGDVIDIGLGLRPDLTGKGYGLSFVVAGLNFAQRRFTPRQFRLAVAAFNRRALRVYACAGFQAICTYLQATNGSQYEFIEMVRDVTWNDKLV